MKLRAFLCSVVALLVLAPAAFGAGADGGISYAGAESGGHSTGGLDFASVTSARKAKAHAHAIAVAKAKAKARAKAKAKARAKAKAKAKAEAIAKAKAGTPQLPVPAVNTSGYSFPVLGAHSFGGAGARFGAARSGHIHQGQDVPAAEGTPLVAVTRGTIVTIDNQPRAAGNYIVLQGDDGHSYVYMHLKTGANAVTAGHRVAPGARISEVGNTGDSQGAHLHFEIWTGGWFAPGSHAIDPLPYLRAWDAAP